MFLFTILYLLANYISLNNDGIILRFNRFSAKFPENLKPRLLSLYLPIHFTKNATFETGKNIENGTLSIKIVLSWDSGSSGDYS